MGKRRPGCVFAISGGDGVGEVDDVDGLRTPLHWLGNNRLLTGRSVDRKASGCLYEAVNTSTWKSEPFEHPEAGHVTDVSANGETWLLCKYKLPSLPNDWQYRVWSVHDPKGKVTELQNDGDDERVTHEMALSPDGSAVIYARNDMRDDIEEGEKVNTIFVRMLVDKKPVQVDKLPRLAIVRSVCWAPDGKRFAYSWEEYDEKKKVWVPQGIATQNADGSDLTHILKCRPGLKDNEGPLVVCWR